MKAIDSFLSQIQFYPSEDYYCGCDPVRSIQLEQYSDDKLKKANKPCKKVSVFISSDCDIPQ